MKKILKILAFSIGGLLLLLIAAAIILTTQFDPNQYKGKISATVKEKTGRELHIDGKLGWSFFPWIGFETGKLELSNAPGFGSEPFARINAAGAKVELLPLLRKQIIVDTVFLDGLKLNLAKNSVGKTNWDDLSETSASKSTPAPKQSGSDKGPEIGAILVNKIDIRDAEVTWNDQVTRARYAVRHLNLQTGKLSSGEPIDVRLAFDVESGKPVVSKHIDLRSRVKLDLAKQDLDITQLALGVDDSKLTGTLSIKHLNKPAYRFDLALDQIDLDRYLPAPPPEKAGTKNQPPAQPVELPLSQLRAFDLQGKLRIQKLKAMDLHSSNVLIQVSAQNGLINLGPNQADLYGGKYNGHITLDVRGKTPQLAVDEGVKGVDLAPMLSDALKLKQFTGTADLHGKVTAQGLDAKRVMETMNGTASFSVKKGAIKGMDLKKMIDAVKTAQRDNALQKLAELSPKPGDETHFTSLGGTAQIKNGLVRNNDLKVESPDLLHVTGQGTADLPKEMLDYRVTVGSYPVIISGPFSNLKFRVDTSALLKDKIEQKKKDATNKLEQKLKDKLKLFK